MIAARTRADHAPLTDRLSYLLGLRLAIAAVTVAFFLAVPGGVPVTSIGAATGLYLAIALCLEWLGRRAPATAFATLTVMLLVDGLYLAATMYVTGGTQSPMRFLVYLHVVAVSLLASYRTGLKIALWHSLLLFVVLYAQAASLVPPVDVVPGRALELGGLPVLSVTAFVLFALATSIFSALNERELRQRRADLETMVGIGARLDDESDPVRQAAIVLDGLEARSAFSRGLVLGIGDDGLVVLGSRNLDAVRVRDAFPVDPVLGSAWDARRPLAVRRLDRASSPALAAAMPDARRVIVAPMVADGQPVGAIVLEHPGSMAGVERRVMDLAAQVAGTAALSLRNAVLLRRVQDLAERDALTGAANRRSFQASLERAMAPGEGCRDRVSAVLFIDLDDFKVVNDTLGHTVGDELLVAVTERIAGLVRDGDTVARLGGDEFAILTEDLPDLRRSRAMAERLVRELRVPYLVAGQSVSVSASIGVAGARDAVDGAADMVRNADVAMYLAKARGKAGYEVFDPGMHHAIRDRHELAMELQHAVDLQQLLLRYQPIVELASGRLAGVEALVRWNHPERGLIAPGDFIEIAEEHGSIVPIGRWVLQEACRQVTEWARAGVVPADMFVSVNVSAREVQGHGFIDGVRETLAAHGVAAGRLVIELTETALLRATPTTVATLQGLRDLGVRVVIDDFGTGYFSLSHLRQFPVDALKVAREFTQEGEAEGSRSSALASAIVAMARSLGIETVAEGIETPDQAARMRSMSCTYGQGYFYARPLLPAELGEAARVFAASQPEAAGLAPLAAGARHPRRARALAATGAG